MYLGGYQKQLLYGNFVDDLAQMRFSSNGTFLVMPQSMYPIDTEAWVSETRSIAFSDNNNASTNASTRFLVFFCAGQLRYNQMTRSCVSVEECVESGYFIQNSLCVVACAAAYTTSDED